MHAAVLIEERRLLVEGLLEGLHALVEVHIKQAVLPRRLGDLLVDLLSNTLVFIYLI